MADMGRVGQLVHHVHCIGHVGVETFDSAVGDCSPGLDRLSKFLGAPAAKMVEHLEGETDGIGVLVALPAISLLSDFHFLAEGEGLVVGELGVHGDRQVGDDAAEEFTPHPDATVDGMVVKVSALGDQPGGLGQNTGPLGIRQGDRLVSNPFPVGWQAVGEVGPKISCLGAGWFLGFRVNAILDETLVGGEQFSLITKHSQS